MSKHPIYLFLSLLFFSCAAHRGHVIPTPAAGNVPDVPPVSTPVVPVVQDVASKSALVAPRWCGNEATLMPADTWEGDLQARLDSLCQTSGLMQCSEVAILVYDQSQGRELYRLNAQHRMRPASNMKLVTSISALHYLGGNYQFVTDLRITGQVSNGTLQGDVYVVGGMDPTLSPADLASMASALQREGIRRIDGRLYTDLSMKDTLRLGWGWCWDDPWGPLTPLMVQGEDTFAKHWAKALSGKGISVRSSQCLVATAPAGARSLHRISHGIDAVLPTMMKESDNIYAESLFYALAAHEGQRGVGRKQAERHILALIASLGLDTTPYQIADGSGLSLYDYVTPEMLVALLRHAYATPDIYNHLYPSLPIAGVDGTLRKRMKETTAAGNVHAKTGTVNGVSALSGYATAGNGHVLVFSIINQGITQSSIGRAFQDRVCVELTR